MASVTQTIDNYFAGISKQSDLKKYPGQVKDIVNGVPDPIEGLYKRPGAKRIGTQQIENNNTITDGGYWFHYFRDETEGSYIGQVATDGKVRIWSCTDGTEKNVWYHTDNAAYNAGNSDHSSIKSYLTPSTVGGVLQQEDIQSLTINDTTFLNNRSKVVDTTGTTDAREHTHFAYLELLRTENGRQYGLNIYADETATNLTRATRLKIASDTLAEGQNTGTCPGIGTQVFSVTDGSKKNLIFRITTLGQQGQLVSNDDNQSSPSSLYSCSYNRNVSLLHGGEGWADGDTTTVTLTHAKGGGAAGDSTTKATYTIEVEDDETVAVKGTINGGVNGIIRPAPTPFDADTAVTVDTIFGGITTELSGTGVSYKIIGNGIYLHSTSAFSVEVVDQDLMRVMQEQVNSIEDLPVQCRDGYIVKIANSRDSNDDDFFLKFEGNDGLDGPGAWVECPQPGIVKSLDATTMPHVLQRQADGDFLVKKYTWADRNVGDDNTNALPSFADGSSKINRVLFFRNRLALLSGENVILSRPGELGTPSFFAKTALAVSAVDPIDISCSSTFPSDLFDGIEVSAGLIVFSTNQQFLLSSDAEILNPDTAKLRSISTYNYNKDLPPISLGTTIGYIDNSGKYSRFNEMVNVQREQEPIVGETSKLVSTLLPKDIDLLTNSRENSLVLFGKSNTDTIYGFKYLTYGEERKQQAWFKWELNASILYHFIIDDNYYFLDDSHFLQKISLIQEDTDPSIDETVGSDTSNYLIHLDNWITISSGSYDTSTKQTTFSIDNTIGGVSGHTWLTQYKDLAVVDIDTSSTRIGRYAINQEYNKVSMPASSYVGSQQFQVINHGYSTGDAVRYHDGGGSPKAVIGGSPYTDIFYILKIDNNRFSLRNGPQGATYAVTNPGNNYQYLTDADKIVVPGDWSSSTVYAGYLYDYQVDFPTIYMNKTEGQQSKSDINSSLIIHRIKLNFGKSGLYETTLQRTGKDDYSETYESAHLDEYLVSDAPYLPEHIQTIPVYESNKNVNIILKSSHPAPATLHAMSWEGDYSPRNYKRV